MPRTLTWTPDPEMALFTSGIEKLTYRVPLATAVVTLKLVVAAPVAIVTLAPAASKLVSEVAVVVPAGQTIVSGDPPVTTVQVAAEASNGISVTLPIRAPTRAVPTKRNVRRR